MDDTPKYESYSLEELYDVAQHIDKEKYPERYALVLQEIEKQKKDKGENPTSFQNPTKSRSGCAPGGCFGMVVGLGAGILWGQIWVPPEAKSADSMDVGFGLMGLAIFGIIGGGFFGALIGAFFNRE